MLVPVQYRKYNIIFFLIIPAVIKTGSGNLTFCVTFHNFSCLMSLLMSVFFFAACWLGICVEVDVDKHLMRSQSEKKRHFQISTVS